MKIKRSSLAGTWYVDDASRLGRQVDELLQSVLASDCIGAALSGVIVPHAGYIYSGRAAAAAYANLRGGSYTRAVIVAPSHFAAFRGAALVDADAFETPLGLVSVDRSAVSVLVGRPLFRENSAAFREEHALEVQLPLLQRVLPRAQVIPILLGDLSAGDQEQVARTLSQFVRDDTVFIISSDFVHYGWRFNYMPFPATGPEEVRKELQALNMGALDRVCAGDAEGFRQYVADTGATICGHIPIGVFLALHRRRTAGQLLRYYTSLDVTGDYEHCVSYASVAFVRPV